MKNIISLFTIDFKNTFYFRDKSKEKSSKDIFRILLYLILIISIIPTYILFVTGLIGIYKVFANLGQESGFLMIGLLASQFIILIFGFVYLMSKFYFSKDVEILIPLPLKSEEILISKFLMVLLKEYITILPIILPFILIYGAYNFSLNFVLKALIAFSFLPVIPLAISSIFVMIIMKLASGNKHKDALILMGNIILVGGIMGFQFILQAKLGQLGDSPDKMMEAMVSNSNYIVDMTSTIFPYISWLVASMVSSNFISSIREMAKYILLNLAFIIIIIKLSKAVFIKSVIEGLELTKTSKKKAKQVRVKSKAKFITICKKEVLILFRTPVYLMNTVAGAIMIPLMLIIMGMVDKNITSILALIKTVNPNLIMIYSIFYMIIMGVLNSVSVTSFSREGEDFWVQQVIPITWKDQLLGRILASLLVQAIGVISVLAVVNYIRYLGLVTNFVIIVSSLLASIPPSILGLIIDGSRPKLDWDTPEEAIKKNMNVLIGMTGISIYVLPLIILSVKLYSRIPAGYIVAILILISGIGTLILAKIFKKIYKNKTIVIEK